MIDLSLSDPGSDTQGRDDNLADQLDQVLFASNLSLHKKYFFETGICNLQDLLDLKDMSEKRKEVIVERITAALKRDGRKEVGYMQLLKFLDILEDWDFGAPPHGRRPGVQV